MTMEKRKQLGLEQVYCEYRDSDDEIPVSKYRLTRTAILAELFLNDGRYSMWLAHKRKRNGHYIYRAYQWTDKSKTDEVVYITGWLDNFDKLEDKIRRDFDRLKKMYGDRVRHGVVRVG